MPLASGGGLMMQGFKAPQKSLILLFYVLINLLIKS